MQDLYVLGTGMNYGTAMEGQLKLMETMCIPTMYNDLEEFSHGMHRSIGRGSSVLLLCTDGLSNTLSEGQMHDFCRGSRDAKQICGRLIAAALARGARDNVTALVLFR